MSKREREREHRSTKANHAFFAQLAKYLPGHHNTASTPTCNTQTPYKPNDYDTLLHKATTHTTSSK